MDRAARERTTAKVRRGVGSTEREAKGCGGCEGSGRAARLDFRLVLQKLLARVGRPEHVRRLGPHRRGLLLAALALAARGRSALARRRLVRLVVVGGAAALRSLGLERRRLLGPLRLLIGGELRYGTPASGEGATRVMLLREEGFRGRGRSVAHLAPLGADDLGDLGDLHGRVLRPVQGRRVSATGGRACNGGKAAAARVVEGTHRTAARLALEKSM